MSEEKPKSRWDKDRQQWIHPDMPPPSPRKRKVGRPRKDHAEQITNPSGGLEQVDQRYNFTVAQITRKHKEWEAEQERKYGVITFRDEQGNLVRDEQDKIVIEMSERFAELFLKAIEVGDVISYPIGDPRGFIASTDPTQAWGWRDTDAAVKYDAAVPEIPVANSEDAVDPANSL